MYNWKILIEKVAGKDKIIACTLSEDELLEEFNAGFGEYNCKPFTAWSDKYAYFPITYEGAEFVGRAPRNICNEPTSHIG